MKRLTHLVLAIPLVVAGLGCGAHAHSEAAYAFHEPYGDPYLHVVQDGHPVAAVAPKAPNELVVVDATLAARCRLPGPAVYFEFDSAELGLWSQEYLGRLATCVLTGPAAGEGIEIVGRADPRGTDHYNYDLGMNRAQSVATALLAAGVPQERVLMVSRGEEKASSDPERWPADRRVTLRLHPDGSAVSPTAVSSR